MFLFTCWSKRFRPLISCYGLLFLFLEGNILHALFCLFYFQLWTIKVCWLLKNLDWSGSLDFDLGPDMDCFLDICSSYSLFWIPYLIVVVILYCLSRESYYWNIKSCIRYCECPLACWIGNDTVLWPCYLLIYFTISQRHFKSYTKVTQITISTFFVLPLADVVPIIFALNLNDSELAMITWNIFLILL